MKKGLAALLIILASVVPPMAVHAAEEQKPAPPNKSRLSRRISLWDRGG